jgi:3-oxoadipate enol-lactonase
MPFGDSACRPPTVPLLVRLRVVPPVEVARESSPSVSPLVIRERVVPFAEAADGTRLHYSVSGPADGEPVLMIQGLGADSRGWLRQRRAFAGRHRVVLFDNRGVGRSDRPPGPYDLEVMAGDAVAVLDAAGVADAHVVGASMGGVISQILAVRNPERVRSLVLACTACRQQPWRRELLAEWAEVAERDGMGGFTTYAVRWVIGPRSLRRFWPAFGAVGTLAQRVTPDSFLAQVEAILAADDGLRFELRSIAVPTLVLVGSQDILTPLGDSEEIADLIPGAELAVIGGGAHGFMFEHAAAFNRTILDFLHRVVAERDDRSEPLAS